MSDPDRLRAAKPIIGGKDWRPSDGVMAGHPRSVEHQLCSNGTTEARIYIYIQYIKGKE